MHKDDEWEKQPDGSRAKRVNGIRIVDRRGRPAAGPIEYLVAREEERGGLGIIGLDVACRVVYSTTLT